MENILITFESDVKGLNTGVEALTNLGKVDKDLAQTFTQTNNSLKQRDALVSSGKSNLSSYAEGLNNVSKAAAGAFGTKVITDYKNASVQAFGAIAQQINKLQEQKTALEASKLKTDDAKLYQIALQQLTKELNALYDQMKLTAGADPFSSISKSSSAAAAEIEKVTEAVDALGQQKGTGGVLVNTGDAVEEVTQLKQKVTELENELDKIKNKNPFTPVNNSATSFRTQLRAMQQELTAMSESGATFSEKYQLSFNALAEKAGELNDALGDTSERVRALGSDTADLDAAVEAANGLAGAYQLAAGATALFGVEDAAMQQTLVKLNAVMAITQGLQQAQNFLRGQSILMIRSESIAQGILNFVKTGSVKATQQSTAATEENIIVQEAETGALIETGVAATGASVAMQVLRAAIIATGIGALVVAIVALVSEIAKYVAETDDATAAQLRFNDALSKAGDYLDAEIVGIEDYNKKAIAAMKERNASDNDLSRQEIANLLLVQDARRRSLDELNKTLEDAKTINELSAADYKKLLDKKMQLEQDLTNGETTLLEKRSDLQVQYYQDSLKNLQAYAQARAAVEGAGGQDNITAQLAANIALAKADATVQLANANLTAGERYKIEVDLQNKIDELRQQYKVAQLTKEKNFIDATAALTKEGSQEEFNAHLAQLTIQKEIDLANAKDNTAAIAKINSEFYKNQTNLIKQYNFQVAQAALETQKAFASDSVTRLQMANYSELSDEMIAAKQKVIEVEANLEVLSINNSEKNEELRKARIKAVYDKELLDKQALEKAKLQAELDNQSNNANTYYQQQSNALNLLSQNFQQFGSARKTLDDAIYKNSAENIVKQRQLLEDSLAGGLISIEDYNKKYADLDQQHNDAVVANAEAAYQRKIALAEFAASQISQLEQSFFQGQLNRIEAEKSANQDLLNNKEITQREFNKRQANLQKQESALKKEQAITEILIDFAKKFFEIKAAMSLQAALLNPAGVTIAAAQIPFLIASEGIALAMVAAQKFKKGGYTGDYGVDDEVGIVHGKEFVAHAGATKRHRAALEAMNQGLFEQYLQKAILNGEIQLPELGFDVPQINMPDFSFAVPDIHLTRVTDTMMHSATQHSNAANIDYDKLGASVAKHIAKEIPNLKDLQHNDITIDERGLTVFVREKNRETEFVNRYYSTKGTKG